MKKQIKHFIFGSQLPNEYICVSYETIAKTCSVILSSADGKLIADVTAKNILLGYKPGILAIPSGITTAENITAGFFTNDILCGSLILEKYGDARNGLQFYTGKSATHTLLDKRHIFFRNLKEKFSKHKNDPLFPAAGLYDQIRVAYSFPRMIKLIVPGQDEKYNVFPSDLNGMIDDKHYILSLRENGKAFSQVKECKKILMCTMDLESYKKIYNAGKNHMKELKSAAEFPILSSQRSATFNFPLPKNCVAYAELNLTDAFQIGIHQQMIFEAIHSEVINSSENTLAHIHEYYALWRMHQQYNDTFYLR